MFTRKLTDREAALEDLNAGLDDVNRAMKALGWTEDVNCKWTHPLHGGPFDLLAAVHLAFQDSQEALPVSES